MKIAYLTSCYPAVSHTFVLREVFALRARGVSVGTFSVRRAGDRDVLGDEAQSEAKSTRWLVPPPVDRLVGAMVRMLASRPLPMCRTLVAALAKPGTSFGQRLKWLAYFGEAALLACWLIKEQYDHLHCHFGNSGSSTGMLAARLAGLPFSFSCHGSELLQPEKYRLTEKVAAADFVACASGHGRAQLMLMSHPDHWHKLHIVRCGLPSSHIPALPESGGSSEILCVARLSPEKGHLILLDALAALRGRDIDFRCTLVGDGPMRSTIETRVKELAIDECVRLTGSLAPEQVRERYRSAGVVVLPSFCEGVPVVLMEALAHGCPVVATRVGGVPELVEHGTRGLLVGPGDAGELADALQRVLRDPQWARSLAKNGWRFVRQEFNLETSVDRLAELFGQMHRLPVEDRVLSKGSRTPCRPKLISQNS